MKKVLTLVLLSLQCSIVSAQEMCRLSGTVTDFHKRPLDSVTVRLMDDRFNTLHQTLTGPDGSYTMDVPTREYFCLYAIKLPEYGKTKLEYWAWNVPLFKDLKINPQYERMEIYGMNIFEPKVGPYETYMIYFRPMSLGKSLALFDESTKKAYERKAMLNHDTIDIAPRGLTPEELDVEVNGHKTQVVSIQKMVEYCRGLNIYAYVIQVLKPKEAMTTTDEYDKISLTLHSKETNEWGKGEVFTRRITR